MPSPPPRQTSNEEESALLANDHNQYTTEPDEPQSSRPSWQFWRTPSRHVSFAALDDELPSPTTMKRQKKKGWEQAALYAVLIIVGAGVGVIFGRGLQRPATGDGLGDGPMVPPQWPSDSVSLPDAAKLIIAYGFASESCLPDRSVHRRCGDRGQDLLRPRRSHPT